MLVVVINFTLFLVPEKLTLLGFERKLRVASFYRHWPHFLQNGKQKASPPKAGVAQLVEHQLPKLRVAG
ncbi:MAG TPA: hypothetical protein PK167_13060, partial [Prolixibacteraceae bacterium]|nr:hypothetical protein [Prolixibacteraceae bacterium]